MVCSRQAIDSFKMPLEAGMFCNDAFRAGFIREEQAGNEFSLREQGIVAHCAPMDRSNHVFPGIPGV